MPFRSGESWLAGGDEVCRGNVHTEIEQFPEVGAEGRRDYDFGNAKVDKVDDEHGDRGEGRDEDFMAPTYVEEVVA